MLQYRYRLTNVSPSDVYVSDLGLQIDAGTSVTVRRSAADIYEMVTLGVLRSAGVLTLDELDAASPAPVYRYVFASAASRTAAVFSSNDIGATAVQQDDRSAWTLVAAPSTWVATGSPVELWSDQQGDISQGAANAGLTYEPYRDTSFRMYFLRHDQDDSLHFRFQLDHSWDPTTNVHFHLHIVPMVSPVATRNVRFTGQYAWASVGTVIPANSGWTSFTKDVAVDPADGFKSSIGAIFVAAPPSTADESAILLIRVTRAGTDLADTYNDGKTPGTPAANLGLLSADLHYLRNKLGTVSEFPSHAL